MKVRKCKGDNLWLAYRLHFIPQAKAMAVCDSWFFWGFSLLSHRDQEYVEFCRQNSLLESFLVYVFVKDTQVDTGPAPLHLMGLKTGIESI